ncbi:inhibitor of growth protein 4-like [Dendronephthya gigantea]|uniref:inhibitor of growth protein 4-like n=1 Tax=Dendronephthya gigantea TaxID=151771 RepID=UPI00106ABB13|nr:inhibitor of growth protein 4-like [Dendronephthya gigantea]XP_028398091.1 inhibitor of growth protein 4-like [Dendronephthya gigantea]
MHYLEDYLELIEQLPTDLRERFTEMREMDLQVQNAIDDLDSRVKEFLSNGATATEEWKEENYKNLKQEYSKAVEDAEEKVNIATQIYDLVDRHLRKLDQELSKFKMELEADNAGITEILEQRSLLLDEVQGPATPPVSTLQPIQPSARNIIPPSAHSHKRKATSMDIFTEDIPNGDISVPVSTVSLTDYTSFPLNPYLSMEPKISLPSSQTMQYHIGTVGAGSNTTGSSSLPDPQSSYQVAGRNTGNMKSYTPTIKSEYSGLPVNTSLAVTPQLSSNPYASSAAGMNVNYAPTSSTMASMGHMDLNPAMSNTSSNKQHARKKQKTSEAPLPMIDPGPLQTEVISQAVDWVYDPNEPRYCLCNQVSYGEMVGCDNPNCSIEWFHYGCVGITDPPKGKWFCPKCIAIMSKKKRRC